jgi:hypothetical protein
LVVITGGEITSRPLVLPSFLFEEQAAAVTTASKAAAIKKNLFN